MMSARPQRLDVDEFETVRERLTRTGERLVEPFARLTPRLSQAQLDHLLKIHFAAGQPRP